MAFAWRGRYICCKRDALCLACVQLHGRRFSLNINSGFTACCGGIARHLTAVHYELGAVLVHLYRAAWTTVSADRAAIHGEGAAALLQLDCRAVFAAAVGVAADLTARLQRRMGRVAVGDNIKCCTFVGGGVVIDLAPNRELCTGTKINNCGRTRIIMDASICIKHDLGVFVQV